MDSEISLRILSSVHFYLREGFYGTALSFCENRGVRDEVENQIAVLKGVGLILLEKSSEAIRCLESVRNGPCNLGALYGLKAAHLVAANPDKKSLSEIESAISSAEKSATEVALLSAAEVLYFNGQATRAKTLLEPLAAAQLNLSEEGRNPKILCLLGWIDIATGKDQKSTKDLFEVAAKLGYPDGHIGLSRLCELHHSPLDMKVITKDLVTNIPSFQPGYIERCRASLVDRNWDGAFQALQSSTLAMEADNAYISYLVVLHAICESGQKIESSLAELKTSMEVHEKDNHQLYHTIAKMLIRISAKNRVVLSNAKSFLAKALQMKKKTEYMVEEIRLAMAFEDGKEVIAIAKDLIQAGSDDPFAILGLSIGYLMLNKVNEASEQFEFIRSTQTTLVSAPLYHFVSALIAIHKKKSFDDFIRHTNDFQVVHHASIQNLPFGLKYLMEFDIELATTFSFQLLEFAPLVPSKAPNEALKRAGQILFLITDIAPGLSYIVFHFSRVRYLEMDLDNAEKAIDFGLAKNPALSEAYLLRAQIRIDKGLVEEADNCLTTGLNFNFEIRATPLYHLIKAKVLKKKGEWEQAVAMLKDGLKLPQREVKENLLSRKEPHDAHRISIQLELIDCYQSMKRMVDAEEAMESAMNQWRGKPEEEQLLLLRAQLLVSKGDADGALSLLDKVTPKQPNYQSARMKMATIYLEEKKDKHMFEMCYRELADSAPSPARLTLLGDALMSIDEPEKAIEKYEKALKMTTTRDMALTEKIGEAYVMCHLYTKAINFYESAMNATKDKGMRMKLAELLLKLGNTDKCERILKQPLAEDPSPIDPVTISANVKFLQLLSKLHLSKNEWVQSIQDLDQARQLQLKLIQKNSSDSPSNLAAKKETAKITCMLAELKLGRREMREALDLYTDALSYDPANVKIILAIAQVHMAMGRLERCNESCRQALNIEKNNGEAILMMADILYMQNNIAGAMEYFHHILIHNPSHYHALARYIELAWRIGKVDEARKFLKMATSSNPRAGIDSGYNYCKGLHEWYSGEPNSALQAFNRARKDQEWGDKSLCNMIEICLNPDNEVLGGELEYSDDQNDSGRMVGTKTAEKFLAELRLKNQGTDEKYTLMENFILVASGDKNKIAQALTNLIQLAGPENQPVQRVGAILGAARACSFLKNSAKAKLLLKRVVGHPWTLEDADYLEKCWLLLADMYISQGKTEQANELLRQVLKWNVSCIKALEFQAFMNEKEGRWQDAALFYENAWRLSSGKNPTIGYKLAYNYLKCKRIYDCLDICNKVLAQHPTYPKIKKEIVDKARSFLRC